MNDLSHRGDAFDLDRWLQRVLMIVLAASVCWFVVKTIHWPLTGDASLMHYVSFLMDHGRAPYRDIGDINLPVSYAPAWVVSHLFGAGSLPWRIYDFALLLVAGIAMYFIAKPYGVFPAVWAGSLFALIHGRDGLLQVGQRDLLVAVLLVVGVALLFCARRREHHWLAVGFGGCVGFATMIKPVFAAFLLLVLVDYLAQRKTDKAAVRMAWLSVLGWLGPVLGCALWLRAKGSLAAFWYDVSIVGPYHERIGHAPTRFLLSNSVSPIGWLIAAWIVMRLAMLARADGCDALDVPVAQERRLLLIAAALGYLAYLVQQRGYPYHRYTFQVFLLLVLALDFADALRSVGRVRWLSGVALVWGALVLAPVSAVKAGRYEWQQRPFRAALEADLLHVERKRGVASLDGRVECLDSISGCVAALDDMHVVEDERVMYDEFLFNPGGARVVDETRANFLAEVEKDPPLAFVESAPLFPAGPDGYKKLDQWPQFRDWLCAHYSLEEDRTFTVAVREAGKATVPPGYRIYVRK